MRLKDNRPQLSPAALRDYEALQKKRLKNFPDCSSKISDLEDTLAAIWALIEAYSPSTLKTWEDIVNRIFDESGYSPISLYSIHTGKGGSGQVSFILCPDELPLEHPKQVPQEREQELHLLYVALTRTLADGVDGSGILYLIIREDQKGKPKYPAWLPSKYRRLLVESAEPNHDKKRLDTSSIESDIFWAGHSATQAEPRENSLGTSSNQDDIPPLSTTSMPSTVTVHPSKQKSVVVKVSQVKAKERVVGLRSITFTCNHCGQTVTQERMPGPLPAYSSVLKLFWRNQALCFAATSRHGNFESRRSGERWQRVISPWPGCSRVGW